MVGFCEGAREGWLGGRTVVIACVGVAAVSYGSVSVPVSVE